MPLKPLDPVTWTPKALADFTDDEQLQWAAACVDEQRNNAYVGAPTNVAALTEARAFTAVAANDALSTSIDALVAQLSKGGKAK